MKQKPSGRLLELHDFVLVGYRGVDDDGKLQSNRIKRAVKGINNSLLSDASLINLHECTERYKKELEAANIDHLISSYFDTGIADAGHFRNDPVVFKTPVTFTGIAKALYPVVVIMSLFK